MAAQTPSVESPVSNAVTATESWLKQHETLIIVFLVLLVGGWLANHYLNHVDTLDKQRETAYEAQLQDQKAANAQLQTQINQTVKQYQEQLTAITQQNATLAASIQQRDSALTKQQQVDKTATPVYIDDRWKDLIGPTYGPQVTLTANGTELTPAASEATVSQLEQVPVLEKNVTDLQTQQENLQDELKTSQTLITQQTQEIAGLKTEVNDNEKACTATVTTLKAQATKGKLKWFGIGYVAGFISGVILK